MRGNYRKRENGELKAFGEMAEPVVNYASGLIFQGQSTL